MTEAVAPETYDQDVLVLLAGLVGQREFNGAYEAAKPALWEWLNNLPLLSDERLFGETQFRIYDSANCGRFRGNFEDIHCRATACYHEAERRHGAAGHAEDCHGPTIYSRAHAQLMRDHGYTPTPDGTCTCPNMSECEEQTS